jgi:hypothetical protein
MKKDFGNNIIISSWGGDLSEESVCKFEEEIGARLPEGYRSFLLEYNGGKFDEGSCAFLIKEEEMIVAIDCMGALNVPEDDEEFIELGWFRREMTENLPHNLFIFADEGQGGVFGFWIGGIHTGKVVFVSGERVRDSPVAKDDSVAGIYSLAENFEAFLELAASPEDLEDELYK